MIPYVLSYLRNLKDCIIVCPCSFPLLSSCVAVVRPGALVGVPDKFGKENGSSTRQEDGIILVWKDGEIILNKSVGAYEHDMSIS